MRQLDPNERALVQALVSGLDNGARDQALTDLANAVAMPVTEDNSRILFGIKGYERPPYRGQHSFAGEAKMKDRDNAELSVVLYADENGRLLELEFIRWAPGNVLGPRWETLEFIAT